MSLVPTAVRVRVMLENDIVEGRYQPGDKVDVERIASAYGCSRTPVREALQALEASGLVSVRPKNGTFVSKLDIAELTQRFEVMAELETLCASLACRRATPADLADISKGLATCSEAASCGDADLYYAENTVFHQAIYTAAHNDFLRAETQRLQAMLQPYRRRQLHVRDRIQKSLSDVMPPKMKNRAITNGRSSGASTCPAALQTARLRLRPMR